MRVAERIELNASTDRELRILAKRRRVQARVQQRARVILLAAEGWRVPAATERDLDRLRNLRDQALEYHATLQNGAIGVNLTGRRGLGEWNADQGPR